jgi:hypothetical protein
LSYKESVHNDVDHIEIVVEIQALAQVELSLGHIDMSAQLYSRGKAITSRLLDQMKETQGLDNFDQNQYNSIANSMLMSVYSLRTIEKLRGNIVKAGLLQKEARAIKKLTVVESVKVSEDISKTDVIDDEWLSELLSLRQQVRQMATKLGKQSDCDCTHIHTEVSRICGVLKTISLGDNTTTFQGSLSEYDFLCIIEEFYQSLLATIHKTELNEIRKALYEASDSLRKELREFNICVHDKELAH